MNDNMFKEILLKIEKTRTEKSHKLYEWIKHITILATTLLSVLVSLHNKRADNLLEKYTYLTTIVSLSLSVLFGVIYLFSEVHILHKIEGDLIELSSKHDEEINNVELIFQGEGFFYRISLKVFLILSTISLISLVYYSILMA